MWRRARRSKRRGREAEAGALVLECESFLAGRYAYEVRAQGLPVPDWAWLGVLTHAPTGLLVAVAAQGQLDQSPVGTTGQWQRALALLARELLEVAAATGRSVEEFQRSILLDLELTFSASVDGSTGTGPWRIVGEVLRALEPYRNESRP